MKRILFVDDEPRVLMGLENLLWDYFDVWEVETATSGAQALEMLQRRRFDVLVTDMRMPQMDGAQLLSEVKPLYPDMILFVLSGHADTEAMLQAMSSAHRYLSKPCDAEELIRALESAFELQEVMNTPPARALLSELTQLPPQPHMYSKLQAMLASGKTNFETLAAHIGQDTIIATRIVQVANSVFFSQRRSCSSIAEAVARVGIDTVASVLATMEISSGFERVSPAALNWLQGHMAEVASVSKMIASGREDESQAFLAGLLHDVGQLVFMLTDPQAYQGSPQEMEVRLLAAEQEVFACTHEEVGSRLLNLWGFDYAIIEAVAHHHHVERAFAGAGPVAQAVAVANLLFEECEAEEPERLRRETDARLEGLVSGAQLKQWRAQLEDYFADRGGEYGAAG